MVMVAVAARAVLIDEGRVFFGPAVTSGCDEVYGASVATIEHWFWRRCRSRHRGRVLRTIHPLWSHFEAEHPAQLGEKAFEAPRPRPARCPRGRTTAAMLGRLVDT